MFNEIWKPIPGYENYEASNFGRIKSLNYNHTGKEQILKTKITNQGREAVTLSKNKTAKMFLVHRLVWESFNGPIPNNLQINHIDENPLNNNISNLNLMTAKENSNWGTHIQRVTEKNKKKIVQCDINGKSIHEFESLTAASEYLGLPYKSCGNISSCLTGRYNIAYGYKWKYKN